MGCECQWHEVLSSFGHGGNQCLKEQMIKVWLRYLASLSFVHLRRVLTLSRISGLYDLIATISNESK